MIRHCIQFLSGWSRPFRRSEDGAAAAEMVLWVAIMIVPVLSVIEIGTYSYHRMMVEMAANNGAQAVRSSCSSFA